MSRPLECFFFNLKKFMLDILHFEAYNVPRHSKLIYGGTVMVQFSIIFFLVIPVIFFSLVLLISLCRYSTLFTIPDEEPQFKKSLYEFSQPGLSRMELRRITAQVRRADRKRRSSNRPMYFFA